MIFGKYLKNVEKFTADNSPALLAAVAVVGTFSTAVLTGRATFKAAEILAQEDRDAEFYGKPIDTRIKVMAVWQEYIPPAGAALLTVTCIVFSHRISTRRTMAMAAAYSITDKAYAEYRDKVMEKFGENKERAVRDEIQQDRCMEDSSNIVIMGAGKVLCYEKWSGRYFESSMEEIKKAQNDTNYEILHNNYCSLGDFYHRLGLEATPLSEEFGWNTDHPLDIHFSTVISDDQRPCLAIDFHVKPIRRFDFFK